MHCHQVQVTVDSMKAREPRERVCISLPQERSWGARAMPLHRPYRGHHVDQKQSTASKVAGKMNEANRDYHPRPQGHWYGPKRVYLVKIAHSTLFGREGRMSKTKPKHQNFSNIHVLRAEMTSVATGQDWEEAARLLDVAADAYDKAIHTVPDFPDPAGEGDHEGPPLAQTRPHDMAAFHHVNLGMAHLQGARQTAAQMEALEKDG